MVGGFVCIYALFPIIIINWPFLSSKIHFDQLSSFIFFREWILQDSFDSLLVDAPSISSQIIVVQKCENKMVDKTQHVCPYTLIVHLVLGMTVLLLARTHA